MAALDPGLFVRFADGFPGDRAIGGRAAEIGPYAVPLLGGVATQSPLSATGAVAVTVGRLVMSAAVSDNRIRRLACANSRCRKTGWFAVCSNGGPSAGRLIKSIGAAPWDTRGRSSFLAPVRPFLMLLA